MSDKKYLTQNILVTGRECIIRIKIEIEENSAAKLYEQTNKFGFSFLEDGLQRVLDQWVLDRHKDS